MKPTGFQSELIADCHTHRRSAEGIVCVAPNDVESLIAANPGLLLSTGIHPWATADLTSGELERELSLVERLARLPQVVAVGEAGLDTLRGASPEVQSDLLRRQILISEKVGKSLLLHVVRSGHRIMGLCREMERSLKPDGLRQPWIWHGFRGGREEAMQFLALRPENYISFGSRFNREALKAVPPGRLLLETDDSPLTLADVAAAVAPHLSIHPDELLQRAASNLGKIYQKCDYRPVD